MFTPRLGVNIDHVATLRQVRGTVYPDIILAALEAEEGGADQITCHLREDRRHIQDVDLPLLKEKIRTRLNLELAPTEEMLKKAIQIRPDLVTLVPEKREELTTEGGLNLQSTYSFLQRFIRELAVNGIPVSLFINPDVEDITLTKQLGAVGFEIHTGSYSEARGDLKKKELEKIKVVSKMGEELGLGVYAGHGLTYQNISPLVRIKEIEEYNVGHSIVSRAVFIGLRAAVREMKDLLNGGEE